ncbi:hypothetical protein H4R33_000280 [Dimargaris cristalligena]|nr:hypothetical protein H4R33_000280 [Dimargaris cristalligena]
MAMALALATTVRAGRLYDLLFGSSAKKTNLQDLPTEIKQLIWQNLEDKDLANTRQINHHFKAISDFTRKKYLAEALRLFREFTGNTQGPKATSTQTRVNLWFKISQTELVSHAMEVIYRTWLLKQFKPTLLPNHVSVATYEQFLEHSIKDTALLPSSWPSVVLGELEDTHLARSFPILYMARHGHIDLLVAAICHFWTDKELQQLISDQVLDQLPTNFQRMLGDTFQADSQVERLALVKDTFHDMTIAVVDALQIRLAL